MKYYELLGLTREPFSNSPDPAFFFKSRNHSKCLHRLEIAIRLRRGLNVCLGQIGSGKSTLCRTLIQRMARDETVAPHLVLDPTFSTARELLVTLYTRFLRTSPSPSATHREMMEALQDHLFQEALENERALVLIIDEGQKLVPSCLEVIRELLNYETNDAKLLQVIIFAQEEFDLVLAEVPNFRDRINEFCRLTPLSFWDTRALIRHRLSLAGISRSLFTWPAYWAMHRASQGHPRKIMHLGHKALMTLIVNNQSKVSRSVVLACARPLGWDEDLHPGLVFLASASLILTLLLIPGKLYIAPISNPDTSEVGKPRPSSEFREPINHAPPQEFPVPTETAPVSGNTNHDQIKSGSPNDQATQPASIPPSHAANSGEKNSSEMGRQFPGSRFYIQVGGFQDREYAARTLDTVRRRHVSAGMVHVAYKGQPWDIVYLDHFDTSTKAIRKAKIVRENEGLDLAVVEVSGVLYRFVWQ
ncbi:AAA family ATPase [Desulfonatronum sp. SC1]|uniref:AAA family ATPase n=1 Tax=Desulfonatronum sp. SC1 TaxID=2109626 RepID=UPI0013048088|nr:AAA family ATPase [Desulfonatronum sp. SC1]